MSLTKLKNYYSKPHRLLKVIILTICVFVSIYQIGECIWKLMNPPISTHYRVYLNETIKYPSATICRRPGFKTKLFPKYGLQSNTNLLDTDAFRNFKFDTYTVEDFLNETTYTFEEMFRSYAFVGAVNHSAEVDIKSFQTVEFGRCFTFTPKKTSDIFSMRGGWYFYLKHEQSSRRINDFATSLTGFHLYLHSQNDILDAESTHGSNLMEYMYVESAELFTVELNLQEYIKISTNFNPCVSGKPSYSKSKCLQRCYQQQILELANCTLPWIYAVPQNVTKTYPQCSDYLQVSFLTSAFTNDNSSRLVSNCHCDISCHVMLFGARVVNRRPIDDQNYPNSIVTAHYPSSFISFVVELAGYDFNTFVADIGGSLGFLLGLSVVGMIGIWVKLICSLLKIQANRKCEQKEHQNKEEPVLNNSKDTKLNPKFYDNLTDFDSLDFKCYERTLISDI